MPHADFVHLRVHSAYSLSEGAIKIKQLVELCQARTRMPAVAVTDSGNLFGALEFAQAAAEAGIQPIIGCQLGIRREKQRGQPARPACAPAPDQLVLLVQNEAGYRNLLRLVEPSPSSRASRATAPQLPLADARRHERRADRADRRRRRAASAGCWRKARTRPPAVSLDRLQALFPGRLYVELQRHGLAAERRIEGRLLDLAYARDLPLVATNEVFFADAGMYEAHDALLCIAAGRRARRATAPPRDAGASLQVRGARCARCSPICRRRSTTRW